MKPSPETSSKVHHLGQRLIVWLLILLVVLVVIGLLFPCTNCEQQSARKVAARNDEMQIVNGVRSYWAEYQQYPIDSSKASGPVVFSTDNNLLFDVLRNCSGTNSGNPLNPRGIIFLDVPTARDQNHPKAGIQASTGIWFDPWGSPYRIAIDAAKTGELNGKIPIPGFYSDVGPLQTEVIVWSYGNNGKLGGGPSKFYFPSEPGTPGKLEGSGDVVSWK